MIYFQCKLTNTWFSFKILPLLHLFYHLLVDVSSHLHQQEINTNFYNITILERERKNWMNNASFYIKIWVLKPSTGCKTRFGSIDELFLSFEDCFVGLDENTTYHDYCDTFWKIYH
jgi:hypothetical protein